jgi:hypothetical protein
LRGRDASGRWRELQVVEVGQFMLDQLEQEEQVEVEQEEILLEEQE